MYCQTTGVRRIKVLRLPLLAAIIATILVGVLQAVVATPDSENAEFNANMAAAGKALHRCWNPDYEKGMLAVEQALEIARKEFPRFDKRTSEVLYTRAMANSRSNKNDELSKSDLYEVLEINKHNGKPADLFVCSNLGLILLRQHHWDEVLKIGEELRRDGGLEGQPIEHKRAVLAQLSEAYAGKHQYENALSTAEAAVQLEQNSPEAFALRHYDLMGSLRHVSLLLRQQNPPATEKADDIDKRLPIIADDLWESPSISNPKTPEEQLVNKVKDANDLGIRLLCQGRYSEAERTLAQSIKMHDTSPVKTSAVFYPLLTLACVYRLQDRQSEALRCYSSAEKLITRLKGDEERFGVVYPQCLASLYRSYGELLKKTGNLSEANRCLKLSREHFERLATMSKDERVNSIWIGWRIDVMLPLELEAAK